LFCFSGCNSEKTSEPSEPEKATHEIELENALRLEEEGAWGGAYFLLKDLIEHGYYTEYTSKMESLEHKYRITDLVNSTINYAGLKSNLKNPNSLVIYSVTFTANEVSIDSSRYFYFEIKIDYGATNSFGGMVRDTYETTKTVKYAKNYIGKHVDVSFLPLDDIAKMEYREFDDKLLGDFKVYHSNFINDISNNIWKEGT
jgi:hypothetical protein